MKRNNSFFRQMSVLTSRYIKIFFNDKQNLLLTITIPLLTIIIVALVASGDMYSPKTKMDHRINDGFPILAWQQTVQEDSDEFTVNTAGIGTIDDEDEPCLYIVFDKNKYDEFSNEQFIIKTKDGKKVFEEKGSKLKIKKSKSDGIYSIYACFDEDDFDEGATYKACFTCDVKSIDGKKYGELEHDFDFIYSKDRANVTKIVTEDGNVYDAFSTLSKNFDLNDYVNDNREKLLSLSKAQMSIDGENYVVINDASTLAFVLSDKSNLIGFDNDEWFEYNYYLNCDIDLNDYDDLKPLGNIDNPYNGIFDGNGHIIKNYKLNSNQQNIGFIGVLNGTVKGIGFEDCAINTSSQNAGVIAGTVRESGIITNCYVKNSAVSADNGYVGGIAGNIDDENDGVNVDIHTCYVKDCDVLTKGDYAGGIVGNLNEASLKACYSIVNIDLPSEVLFVGMITGCSNNINNLENCKYLENNDLYAVGDSSSSVDFDDNNVGAINEEKLKEYSAGLSFTIGDNDTEYGFKKDGQLDLFGGTQTGLFMLVCVAIFVGICNSIQEICKERNILKREYMTNLKLTAYMSSKIIVQALICAVQMVLVLAIFAISVKEKEMYSSGVIFHSIWIEYFITMFLLCFAADTMALVISSVVKNNSTANTFIPIVLIVQIVFSGVLFDLGDAMDKFAALMISKWGIAGLAISSRLNDSRTGFLLNSPEFELKLGPTMSTVKDLYMSSSANLLKVWGILLAFIVASSILSTVLLTQVKKDRR